MVTKEKNPYSIKLTTAEAMSFFQAEKNKLLQSPKNHMRKLRMAHSVLLN